MPKPDVAAASGRSRRYRVPLLACKLIPGHRTFKGNFMRVVVVGVVAAMLFCAPVFAQGVKLKSVTNSIGMELIEIPAGKFTMGKDAGVDVTLTKSFVLGKYEVTQGQWKSVMGSEPWEGQSSVQIGEDNPATYVSWDDATEFCKKLTQRELTGEEYRLPTEAEWEYACRAGTETAFSFGNDESKLGEYAWFDGNTIVVREQYAHKVGLKKPNPWGLYDMHGNVWEWCSDWYGGNLSGGADPTGPSGGSNRVFRGGSWWFYPGLCRSAFRFFLDPSNRGDYLGFRVARSQLETVTAAERRQQGTQAKPAPQVAVETRPVMEKPEPVRKVFKSGESVTNSIGMELIEIPAGTFTMSSPASEAGHQDDEAAVGVTLTQGFLLGKTEVTLGEWQQVMGKVWKGQRYDVASKNYPAIEITWDDATEFCEKLSQSESVGEPYRLPTEAEWEYACRAGTTTAFSFGDDESKLGEYAWFTGNTGSEQYAHNVGTKKPNPWGLHDMHGNVFEWCSDWYDESLPGGTDPVGPDYGSSRVLRGGGWWRNPRDCRSANRDCAVPSIRRALGFRVARSQSVQ